MKNIPTPVPSQNKADKIREEATGPAAEPAPKKKTEEAPEPYPTQADLDAIKEGRFNREIKADNGGAAYKTR